MFGIDIWVLIFAVIITVAIALAAELYNVKLGNIGIAIILALAVLGFGQAKAEPIPVMTNQMVHYALVSGDNTEKVVAASYVAGLIHAKGTGAFCAKGTQADQIFTRYMGTLLTMPESRSDMPAWLTIELMGKDMFPCKKR